MTVDKKRTLVNQSRAEYEKTQATYFKLTDPEVRQVMMMFEIAKADKIGKWEDRWAAHPLPDMSEPAKAVCYLTDLRREPPDYDVSHTALLYLRATMRAVDNFFQQVRRSINLLERPILTASKNRRTWYGYSPYNPAMVEKLLDIYRTLHNFVEVGKDGSTPAMRLVLKAAAVPVEDILYFNKHL